MLFTPQAQLVLGVGRLGNPLAADQIFIQGARLRLDVDNLSLLEAQGRFPRLGKDRHAIGMLRVGKDLAPDLATAAKRDSVPPTLSADSGDCQGPDQNADRPPMHSATITGHAFRPPSDHYAESAERGGA